MAKITFLLSQSLESPSGLGRYGPLAKELANLGHQVKVIALHPDFESLNSKKIAFDGVQVQYVAQMHVRKSGDTKSYFSNTTLIKIAWLATWQLSKAVLAVETDILLIGKPHPMNSIAALIARYIKSCKIILDCDDYEAASGRFNSSWQKSTISWFEKWMPHRAGLVTTNTNFMREKLISWGVSADKIFYLPNGIDKDRFAPSDRRKVEILRKEIGLNGRQVVGFVGSLSLASHPVDLLLKAFKQLHDQDPRGILMLVGGGEDIQKLQNEAESLGIRECVKFCGRIAPERTPLYYSLADVSVDPVNDDDSARGRSPLKLFESWACSVPFVCGDVGDRRFLLGDPPAGVLSLPGNAEALAEAVSSVLENPIIADELRRLGFERMVNFTWDKLARSFNDQIQERLVPFS